MPNAKVLSEKQAIVAELTEKLKTASSGVLVDYKGITVAQDTALRAECRKNELDYAVVKNTLVRFAINNVGLEEMDSVLNGTTSLALSHGDPIAPMRVINKFAKQFNGEKFTIKAGFMDGKVLSLDLQGGSAGSGSGHHAGPHHQPGHRHQGHLRAEGRLCRGRRGCRVTRHTFLQTFI